MEVLHSTQQLNHQGLHLPCESDEITQMFSLPHEFPTPLQKGPGAQGGSELTRATTHTDGVTRALFVLLLRDPSQCAREENALPYLMTGQHCCPGWHVAIPGRKGCFMVSIRLLRSCST